MARETAKNRAAKLLGGDGQMDMSWISRVQEAAGVAAGEKPHTLELESVLQSLHHPHAFMMRKCKWCGELFQTNYCYVAYCSDECIINGLAEIGIAYDPWGRNRWDSHQFYLKNEHTTRWTYEPPQYISTQTLNKLEEWAHLFLADLDRLRSQAEIREAEELEKTLQDLQDSANQILEDSDDSLQETQEDSPLPATQQENTDDDPALANLLVEPLKEVEFPDLF